MRAIVIAGFLSVSSSTLAYADELIESEPSEHLVFIGLGLNYRHFGPRDRPHVNVARSVGDTSTPTGVTGEAWSFDERVGFRIEGPLYAAFDFEFGNLSEDVSGTNCRSMVAGIASFGASGDAAGLRLGTELAAGVAQYWYDQEWDGVTELVIEARARADLWILPWGTLGVVVSKSALHQRDWMAGIYVGAHADPYADNRF